MTKAEQKRLETERKHDFINHVYAIVFQALPEESRGYRKSVHVKIEHRNYSRYIRFHSYGQNLVFQIFSDGNVAVELDELCHEQHVEQVFSYDTDVRKQEEFITQFSELAPYLIRAFIGRDELTFHAYMDYISCTKSIYGACKRILEEYRECSV